MQFERYLRRMLRSALVATVCCIGLAACATGGPAPSAYYRHTYAPEEVANNLELTRAAIDKEVGVVWLIEMWMDDGSLIMGWSRLDWGPDRTTATWTSGVVNNDALTSRQTYRQDLASGFFRLTQYEGSKVLKSDALVELRGNPDGSLFQVTFDEDGQGMRSIRCVDERRLIPDGRVQASRNCYEDSAWLGSSTTYFTPVGLDAFPALGALVIKREAEKKRMLEQERQARSEARWNMFGAVMQGLGTAATEVMHEDAQQAASIADLQATVARITEDADHRRQAAEEAQKQAQMERQATMRQAALQQLAVARARRPGPPAHAVSPAASQLQLGSRPAHGAVPASSHGTKAASGQLASITQGLPVRKLDPDRQVLAGGATAGQGDALGNFLAQERRGIHLRAMTCPGGAGNYYIGGYRPRLAVHVVSCISVSYEARCPGTPAGGGTRGMAVNFVGGDSCLGDTQAIPALACDARLVMVDVLDVKPCE